MSSLPELREQIDSVDAKLVDLLNKRAGLVLQVRDLKEQQRLDIFSAARESQILERIEKLAVGGPFPRGALERIFRELLSAMRSLMGEVTVAFVEPFLSPSHLAAREVFGAQVSFNSSTSIEDVFARVASGEMAHGVVPFEVGATGVVPQTFDGLKRSGVRIISEVSLENLSDEWRSERFIVLGRQETPATGQDLTTFIVSVPESSGALMSVLAPFEKRKLTLTRIFSRPDGPSRFLFLITVVGHITEDSLREAVVELENRGIGVQVLGSYPKG